jgi:hypothetical protein
MANDFKSEGQLQSELDAAGKLVPVGKYAHYKHPNEARYEVVGVGIIESNEGICVIYRRIEKGWWWVRTLEDFTAEVEVEGKRVKRFQKV